MQHCQSMCVCVCVCCLCVIMCVIVRVPIMSCFVSLRCVRVFIERELMLLGIYVSGGKTSIPSVYPPEGQRMNVDFFPPSTGHKPENPNIFFLCIKYNAIVMRNRFNRFCNLNKITTNGDGERTDARTDGRTKYCFCYRPR